MRNLIENLKTKLVCRRTRTKMLSSYLSSDYFGFNENTHASSCIKCQVSGKRYKAFKDEFEKEVNQEVEVPEDFASKVMSSLDKKVKTTTSKSTKIILLTLLGILSIVFLIFGYKRSSNKLEEEL
jgi:Cu/Ag efflux pump CusA